MKGLGALRRAWRELTELLWPERCLGCKANLECGVSLFCPRCEVEVSQASLMGVAQLEGCSLWPYEGAVQRAISDWKYHRIRVLERRLATFFLARYPLDRIWPEADSLSLVPVPSHPSRLRARGFDHTWSLAKVVSRVMGQRGVVCELCAVLERSGSAAPQVGRGRAARQENVEGAFEVKGRVPSKVLLIDDVVTTGATLRACASALYAAGAEEVRAFVLARS